MSGRFACAQDALGILAGGGTEMRRDRWSRLVGVVGASLLGLALLGGMVTRAGAHGGNSDPDAIHACVANRDGAVRIVGPTGSCDAKKEIAAHWGVAGPAGLPGEKGDPGDPGVLGSFDNLTGLACTALDGQPGAAQLLSSTGVLLPTWACLKGQSGPYVDLGLVVVDTKRGLMWEKKVAGSGCLHCVDDTYTWCQATGNASGFCVGNTTSWIADVNAENFAGYSDWRVPTGRTQVDFDGGELATILLSPLPSCGTSPCIDPIFGPTASANYWSAPEIAPNLAWVVNFSTGFVYFDFKNNFTIHVRAVRGGP